MRPYFEQDGITVYHGDCREFLPHVGRFDLCLTDPPYGIGIDGQEEGFRRDGSQLRKGHEFMGWDVVRPSDELLLACLSVADTQIVWGGNYFPGVCKPHKGWLVWDKGQKELTMSDGELAYTNMDAPLRILSLHRTHLWQESPDHPTQKPTKLMLWCISKANNPQSVIDPFLGSGTTLVACKKLGIRGVGIEREEKYCEIAVKRILNTTPSLFSEASA